jgi:hypothetical protein
VRFVLRPRARDERSEVRERGQLCRRRFLGGRSLSPRGGGCLDALVAKALSAAPRPDFRGAPRPSLRSPLPRRRSGTGGHARRGIGRGRRRRVVRNRGWLCAGCRSDGLHRRRLRGRRGRRGRHIRRGVRTDRRRSRRGIRLRSRRARGACKQKRKCGHHDDAEGGPQEDIRDAEAHHRPAHPGEWSLRRQAGRPPWLASLAIVNVAPEMWDVNAILSGAGGGQW